MNSRFVSCIVVALPLVAAACATQPNFTFYEDQVDASDAALTQKPTSDATVAAAPDAVAEAVAPGDEGPAPDAMDDGEVADAEVPLDAASGDDAGEVPDAADGGALDAADGAGPDAADGGPSGLDASGGAVEAGCGPLDTTSQCGACHNACDIVHSEPLECSQTGDASSCVYSSCLTGFADCNPSPPNTNGCETPITTITNCTGCGITCNTANSVDAGCGASGCTYSCPYPYGNCNPTAPNTAGCTALASSPNCGTCGNTCTGTGTSTCTEHLNALGNYYDCYANNVHNYTTAHDACAAYTGDHSANNCQTFGCTGEPNTWAVVCSNEINGNPDACVCWEYVGGQIGRYDTSCECPASFDPTWE
jgi:hypothetical protein